MVGVIALGLHCRVGFALGGEAVVDADQDHFLEAHMISQLQADVGDRGTFPDPVAHIGRKLGGGVGGVDEVHPIVHLQPLAGTPREELGHLQGVEFGYGLFHHQVVDAHQAARGEAKLLRGEEDPVHTDRELVLEPAEIGVLQRRTVPNNEASFTFVAILELSQPAAGFAPPGVQISRGEFRNTLDEVVAIAGKAT